jgi:putative membrane protein
MKKNILSLALLATGMFMACNSGSTNTPDATVVAKDSNSVKFDTTDIKGDTKFAVAAADGGMLEIETSKLALSKTGNPQIKDLAQMMIDDHTKAADKLKALAAAKNITLPATLSDDSQKKYDKLTGKTGIDFDKAYADQMVSDHKDVIDAFKKESDNGNDSDLKTFATATLPTLEQHLAMSDSAKADLK